MTNQRIPSARVLAALVLLLAGLLAAQASYVITSDNRRIEGTTIRATADGSIVLTTVRGDVTFSPGQFREAMADEPAEWKQAQSLVAAKKYDEAITLLQDVARRYRLLGWDVQAQRLLGRAQALKGDYPAAVTSYETLFRNNAASRSDPETLWSYRQILLEAKQFDKLSAMLNEVVAKGARPDAARAQTMRGDIKLVQNQVEGAAMDYLRTVVLFASERAQQPEALFKAGDALEKLRDPRAKQMFQKLVNEFPSSPEAQQARGRM